LEKFIVLRDDEKYDDGFEHFIVLLLVGFPLMYPMTRHTNIMMMMMMTKHLLFSPCIGLLKSGLVFDCIRHLDPRYEFIFEKLRRLYDYHRSYFRKLENSLALRLYMTFLPTTSKHSSLI